jgi:hypothetical protein
MLSPGARCSLSDCFPKIIFGARVRPATVIATERKNDLLAFDFIMIF